MKKGSKILSFFLALVFSVTLIMAWSADSSAFPTREIEVVVAYGAGSGSDIWARGVANYMVDYLPKGSKIYITNITGAGGYRGMQYLWDHPADGHTIGFDTFPAQIVTAKLYKWRIDLMKLAWIGRTSVHPFFIFTGASSPFKTLTDLKKKKKIKYGSSSYGSGFYSVMTTCKALGVDVDVVTGFKTKNEAILAMIRGDVDIAEGNEAQFDWVKKGSIRAIAYVNDKRNSQYGEIPTTVEMGYPQVGSGLAMHRLVFAPPKTPENVLDTLEKAFLKAVDDPRFVDWVKKQKLGELEPMGRKEVKAMLEQAVPAMEDAIKGVKLPNR